MIKTILCLILLGPLMFGQGVRATGHTTELEIESLSKQQRKDVKKIVEQYLKENPHVIIDAIRAMQERQNILQKERTKRNIEKYKELIFDDPNSPVIGNLNGDVTIVEFHDYSCGYCKRTFLNLKKLMIEDQNIRFVFKEFPILSKKSELAARAALAAWRQDKKKYMPMHAAFMNTRGTFTINRILRIADKLGLNASKLEQDMKSLSIDRILEANRELAGYIGIKGTPAFVIGDRLIPGAPDLGTLKEIIAEIRKTK